MLYVIDNERARTIRSFAPGGARAGFQHVKKASGSIEPYRAMPLLAISDTLNANGLATSAPKFWGNSCSNLLTREGLASGTKPRKHCFVRLHILDGRILHIGVAVQRTFLPSCSMLFSAGAQCRFLVNAAAYHTVPEQSEAALPIQQRC